MKIQLKNLLIMALASASIEVLVTSCIREEKPNINLDVTDIQPVVDGSGIVKSTIQENGVTLYADMSKADISNLDVTVSVSEHATWSYVDVKMDTTFIEYGGQKIYVAGQCPIKATVTGQTANTKDFSKTRYIKVVCEAEGVIEDDTLTQYVINSQLTSGLIGWEKDGVQSKTYVAGAHLYKIWSVNVLPAGIPTTLTFDNWSAVMGSDYKLPYEYVTDNSGKQIKSDVWSSTNASIALMAKTMPLVIFGASPTTDVAPGVRADNKSALLLTSNDIRYTKTVARPFLAGCCFIGAFDGSDTGALTCTHVGLPFNKLPEELTFWYKYLPMTISDPNKNSPVDCTFNVPGISDYIGKEDKGFIRAVLYRADGDNKWLNGESIRDVSNKDVIAYAEFAPESQTTYKKQTIKFTYVDGKTVDDIDLQNWKYNLAIYFASSYDGFRFICGANMTSQLMRMYQGTSVQDLLKEQMGSQLYIDEMEIKCK